MLIPNITTIWSERGANVTANEQLVGPFSDFVISVYTACLGVPYLYIQMCIAHHALVSLPILCVNWLLSSRLYLMMQNSFHDICTHYELHLTRPLRTSARAYTLNIPLSAYQFC
ncbi:hypothetical protein P692DRAFT_20101235 [Suillus brevipes Sb2]|nr:hypothetical protein P692DRAFT_20101235 [Suillus brevipes Sb2]